MKIALTAPILVMMAALTLNSGCVAGAYEPAEEVVGEAENELIVDNALTANALTANGLTANALTANALTANALTANALTANALTANALQDPNARLVLKYVTSCALPEGEHFNIEVDGVTYGFHGEIGLAPTWGKENGSCDARCQSWVTACVLSRVNHLGETVHISIRGNHEALQSTRDERVDYLHREATYYGNIFLVPNERYACLSPGETAIPRVCGDSLEDCVMDVVGTCDDVCDSPKKDGAFRRCRDAAPDVSGDFPDGTQDHVGSVTVFLQ